MSVLRVRHSYQKSYYNPLPGLSNQSENNFRKARCCFKNNFKKWLNNFLRLLSLHKFGFRFLVGALSIAVTDVM